MKKFHQNSSSTISIEVDGNILSIIPGGFQSDQFFLNFNNLTKSFYFDSFWFYLNFSESIQVDYIITSNLLSLNKIQYFRVIFIMIIWINIIFNNKSSKRFESCLFLIKQINSTISFPVLNLKEQVI